MPEISTSKQPVDLEFNGVSLVPTLELRFYLFWLSLQVLFTLIPTISVGAWRVSHVSK